MKILLAFCFLVFAIHAKAQHKLEEYKAENGITYHPGDEVKLGRGSAPNGGFLYLQLGGWGATMNYNSRAGQDQMNISRQYANTAVKIKKIHQYKMKGGEKVFFVVGAGAMSNFNLQIDEAIQTCEVTPCTSKSNQAASTEDIFDKIKKLKALLDAGAITQDEFDAQKKKLLENK